MKIFSWLRRKLQQSHAKWVFHWVLHRASEPFVLTHQPAMILAPHQDDETFGCGGLIALKRSRPARVHVVFLTDGSAAPNPILGMSAGAFTELRKNEARAALKILGVEEQSISFLDLPDGCLSTLTESAPAIRGLCELLTAHQPAELWVPHRKDRHPDHEAAYRMALSAIRRTGLRIDLIQYSIWMMWSAPLFLRLAPRHLRGAFRLCIQPVLHQKQQAIHAYRSQHATLPEGFLDQFCGDHELFFRSSPSVDEPGRQCHD